MEITLGQSLAAFVSAILGAVLALFIGVSHKQLCALISFAAGTLLAAAAFHIIPEAWHQVSPLAVLAALATGFGFFFLVSRYVSHMCPACAASHFEHQPHEPKQFNSIFLMLAIALTIHSIMDGIAISVGGHASHGENHSVFFTIAIHKLPEGLALCALLLGAGYARTKSFVLTCLFELSTVVGWAIGHFFLQEHLNAQWLALLMVHVAGGFVYLALHAVVNEMKDHSPKFILAFFAIGFIFMALVH